MIGQQLKIARDAAGLSLDRLENRIGGVAAAKALGGYERNESTPPSAVLLALAGALGVRVDFFLGDDALTLESLDFPAGRAADPQEAARIEGCVLYLLERHLLVEDMLDLPSAR